MPYTAPSTVSAGQTYTSAAHNVIVNDIIDHESRLLTTQNTQYPFRNILINGAMQISQRATSVSGITSGNVTYNTADRWAAGVSANGTWTNAITADTPTGSGFRNAFRMTATVSAVTGTGSYVYVQQRLEGQTLQHLKKGTSSAQQLTLQFWVKSNRIGTYIAELIDNDNTRQVSASYTVNAADTWESKTVTFPTDTSGALDNDANYSLALNFWLSAGTDYTSGSLATSWGSTTNTTRAVGQTNAGGATNAYWQVTGVQLEPGSVASPYEFILYGDELRRCQRYYYRHVSAGNGDDPVGVGTMYSNSQVQCYVKFPTNMRNDPILESSGGTNYFGFFQAVADYFNTFTLGQAATTGAVIFNATEIAGTAGQAGMIYLMTAAAAGTHVSFSAEL